MWFRLQTFQNKYRYIIYYVCRVLWKSDKNFGLNRNQITVICPWLTTIRKWHHTKKCLCLMPNKNTFLNERVELKSIFCKNIPKISGKCPVCWSFNARICLLNDYSYAKLHMVPANLWQHWQVCCLRQNGGKKCRSTPSLLWLEFFSLGWYYWDTASLFGLGCW